MPHALNDTSRPTFSEFVQGHKPQLETSGIPERYWNTLYEKLTREEFDAGNAFTIMRVEEESDEDDDVSYSWEVTVATEDGIDMYDTDHIYLIDHAWTYQIRGAKSQLRDLASLRSRMVSLMDIDAADTTDEEVVEAVFNNMWRYNQTYSLGNMPLGAVWYVMDEFGSRIQHADDASFRVVPFYYVNQQISYSILWPVRSVAKGEKVTRNYVEDENDLEMRKCRLLPWKPVIMTHVPFHQTEPSESYFLNFGRDEHLPPANTCIPRLPNNHSIRIFTDDSAPYLSSLTDQRFEVVTTETEADVIWSHDRLFDFRSMSANCPDCLVSSFPSQNVLLIKDLLAAVSRRMASSSAADDVNMSPPWLPVTFNIVSELDKFVSNFQHRASRGMDNHWICRSSYPDNGQDTHITDNLDYILRLPSTGPKVISKYIHDPVLLSHEDMGANVKFSLSFLLLLESVSPLKMYLDKRFTVKTAKKSFDLQNLDDQEKHITSYNETSQISYEDFISTFEQQNANHPWCDIQEKIEFILMCLMRAATAKQPPCGLGHAPQSRAAYSVHVALAWHHHSEGDRVIQPMLLGISQKPADITEHSKLYPGVINQIFSQLFLNDESGSSHFVSI